MSWVASALEKRADFNLFYCRAAPAKEIKADVSTRAQQLNARVDGVHAGVIRTNNELDAAHQKLRVFHTMLEGLRVKCDSHEIRIDEVSVCYVLKFVRSQRYGQNIFFALSHGNNMNR